RSWIECSISSDGWLACPSEKLPRQAPQTGGGALFRRRVLLGPAAAGADRQRADVNPPGELSRLALRAARSRPPLQPRGACRWLLGKAAPLSDRDDSLSLRHAAQRLSGVLLQGVLGRFRLCL